MRLLLKQQYSKALGESKVWQNLQSISCFGLLYSCILLKTISFLAEVHFS